MSPTTLPADPQFITVLKSIPAVAYIVVIGGVVLLGRYLQLLAAARPDDAAPDSAPRLAELHRALRAFAAKHGGRLPDSLNELSFSAAAGIAYRAVRGPDPDEKLLVAHDAAPNQRVIEFPHARPARNILFLSGRVRLVSESAFQRLLEADEAYRAKLGYAQA